MDAIKPIKVGMSEDVHKENEERVDVAEVVAETNDNSLDEEFIDKRSVSISLVDNYSMYRKVNIKTLGPRSMTIGSSIISSRTLSSNKEEVETYFPALIGLSPNNPEFITRVKAWLSNIQFVVNEKDAVLNTSFIYNHKRDYLAIVKQEDKIDAEYNKVDRSNSRLLKEALKRKIDALNTLESTKYKLGRPVNLEEYLIYRHCLLYREVAKDTALINSDPYIRFYIKDDAKESERNRKIVAEKNLAMRNFIELQASDSKFNAVYTEVCIATNKNLIEAALVDKTAKISMLMDYVNTNPDKFNKIINDKNLSVKAFINILISRGELVKSEYNQQISTADGTFVGSNMNEAIAFFNNPANAGIKLAFENKMKLF